MYYVTWCLLLQGMMRSAEYIMKKLQKQRLLEEAFAEKGVIYQPTVVLQLNL